MNFTEEAKVFRVADEAVVSVIAKPEASSDCGVLIIVGGPQYRVGSHRQFVLLSRQLAAAGFSTMRLDYRGMGDSDGVKRSFENVSTDIGAAIDTLFTTCTGLKRVVLWGLCDAASAALIYQQESHDPRVAGMILLNPWVRSESSLAQAQIKHYYGQRLLEKEFWAKVFRGKFKLLQSLRELIQSARRAHRNSAVAYGAPMSFQEKMTDGLGSFDRPALLILSENDLTAREFQEFANANPVWSSRIAGKSLHQKRVAAADHTFSSQEYRRIVERETVAFIRSLS